MDADKSSSHRSKRVRRPAEVASDSGRTSEHVSDSTSGRPTPAERQEALNVIQQMKDTDPPILPRRGQPPKVNVVACAIALSRGEQFKDDRSALRLFGAHPETKVREDWVNGKLHQFAPAGFSTPGTPLPTYLIERSEAASRMEAPSYVDVVALRTKWAPPADGSEEADFAEANAYWLSNHLAQMAQRERDFRAWEAAHGVERDAEFAVLVAEQDSHGLDFYWALGHEVGRRPKWQLRTGVHLDSDCTCTIGQTELKVEEPILLYRGFRPFTGNVVKAQQHFSGDHDFEWLEEERLRLEPAQTECSEVEPHDAALADDPLQRLEEQEREERQRRRERKQAEESSGGESALRASLVAGSKRAGFHFAEARVSSLGLRYHVGRDRRRAQSR